MDGNEAPLATLKELGHVDVVTEDPCEMPREVHRGIGVCLAKRLIPGVAAGAL